LPLVRELTESNDGSVYLRSDGIRSTTAVAVLPRQVAPAESDADRPRAVMTGRARADRP
jgi:hypothetical protein